MFTSRKDRAYAIVSAFVTASMFLVAAGLSAQASPQAGSKPSPRRVDARTLILPRQLVAGQKATLAVLDAQGRLLPDAVVEFSNGTRATTDVTGRAIFVAPSTAGVLSAHFEGRRDAVPSAILSPANSLDQTTRISAYPRVVPLSDRFEMYGQGLRGEADGNRAIVGGKDALVLAASPIALVLLPAPELLEGATEFSIESGEHLAGPFPITFVLLEVAATKQRLAPNQTGVLTVRVPGSKEQLPIEARNLSPDVVAFRRGKVERATTSGGSDNIAKFELRGLRAGDFSIAVRLVPVMTAVQAQ